jgi:integrase
MLVSMILDADFSQGSAGRKIGNQFSRPTLLPHRSSQIDSGRRGNGEGSITKRKDGLYMARYTVETATAPKRKAIYAKTRQDAAEKLTRAMADRDGGFVFDDENLSVGEYLDTWLKGLTGSVRQSILDGYEIAVRVHIKPALGRLKLRKLTPAHVASFYQDKLATGAAPASVNKLHWSHATSARP